MRNKRLILILIGIVLCGLIVFGIVSLIRHNAARSRLLQAAHLENAAGLKEIGYTNWTDWLKYKNGYEIIAFSVDKKEWKAPAEWTREETPVSLDELESALGVRLDRQELNKLNVTSDHCSAWFFLDDRDEANPFDQREFHFAYVSETADSMIVVIYRGYQLYGVE